MDMLCRHCGEPWDHDELHNGYGPYKVMGERFRKLGCNAFDTDNNEPCDRGVVNGGGVLRQALARTIAMQELSPYPEEWCEE